MTMHFPKVGCSRPPSQETLTNSLLLKPVLIMTMDRRTTFALASVILFLILGFLTQSITNAQTASHYGDKVGDSGGNLVGFDLTTYSPSNQQTYANTMSLNFKIDWIYGLMFYDNAKQYGLYAYQIDNNPPVNLPSNQKSNSSKDFIAHPSFSSIIDISNLTNGQHQLAIIADMEWNPFGYAAVSVCNQTSSAILFSVQNTIPISTQSPTGFATLSPTPTPTVPEFSLLTILPLFIFILSISTIVRLRKRTEK